MEILRRRTKLREIKNTIYAGGQIQITTEGKNINLLSPDRSHKVNSQDPNGQRGITSVLNLRCQPNS